MTARCCLGLVATLAALVAGCQPLPHPFAADKPPAALIAVPDNINIAVGAFTGEPAAAAAKLPTAVAQALVKHNIPASSQTVSTGSYQLDGRVEQRPAQPGQSTLTVFWQLRDPQGKIITERNDKLVAATRDWNNGEDAPIGELAAAGASGIAALIAEETPPMPKEQPGGGRIRVAIRKIAGAPGDGNDSLASSLTAVLKHRDIELVDAANGKPDLAVEANITVDPPRDGKQHVKIVWHVARAAGAEVGTVAQENDIPKGRLDGPWGDVAYSVAMAAEGGIMQLVDRGAPPHKLGTEATAAAGPPVPPSAPADRPLPDVFGAPAVPAGPAPVAGNLASPAVNLPPVNVTPQQDAMPKPLGTPDVPVFIPYRGVPIPH
jgi:hypothetical protein